MYVYIKDQVLHTKVKLFGIILTRETLDFTVFYNKTFLFDLMQV